MLQNMLIKKSTMSLDYVKIKKGELLLDRNSLPDI